MSETRSVLAALCLACLWVLPAAAGETGRIEGTVTGVDGSGLAGVTVELGDRELVELTDMDGAFAFAAVPTGIYSLFFSLGESAAEKTGVEVVAGQTTTVEKTLDWRRTFAETLTVYSASRRPERIVEAPAAITALSAEEIALEAASGQIPKLLEFTVGAEVTQSGLYDFNFNTRGFNMTLTRRVQTLVDGRDPSIPFVSSQEWSAAGMLTEDLASVELVRGPTAALYGANSFNGVLNLVTKTPRDSQGGKLHLTAGELSTFKAGLRWAGDLGGEKYFKLLGEHIESDDFTRSRDQTAEYEGLALEAVPLDTTRLRFDSGAVRLDKYLRNGHVFTVDGGVSDGGGVTFISGVGRTQAPDIERSWARVNYNSPRWNILGYYNGRYGPDQVTLSSGTRLTLDSSNYKVEVQHNREFAHGRGRFAGGFSYGEETVDSADRQGVQTLFAEPIESDEQALFGQLDYDLTDRLRLVVAARRDESSLYDTQVSPKGSLVYQLRPDHTLRLSYNEAFQYGTYAELFLDIPAGLPLDLSALEALFAPLLGGVPLGLEFVPILGLGNPDLEVEQIRSVELSYSGILGRKAFLAVNFYRNEMQDFITDVLPGVNPSWGPWVAPAELPPEVAQVIEATLNGAVPGLTNDPQTGAPLIVLSLGNTGRVDSQGLELALSYAFNSSWQLDFNTTWFDFDIRERTPGTTVNANAAEYKLNLSLTSRLGPVTTALRYRWVDEFDWGSGIYVGVVPSYSVFNLSVAWDLSERWQLGANVSNLLDDEHYELFGGDVIGRRALAYASVSW